MNEPLLANSDVTHLYQIVDEANRNYLKQSRLNDKPAFNILRVLAALRLLFPDSPPILYNAIIFITKNYDPQSYYHWKKAIEDLHRNKNALFKSKSNYCRPEISLYTKTYQNSFNRSRINESLEHLQSKSYAQINIPHELSASKHESFFGDDQKEQSQTNAETGKRQFYTKADSISHVSKNHYISFEPCRNSTDKYRSNYDKENINSTNVEQSRRKESAYHYIEAIQRDLNRTTKQSQLKTPIDQSFIKNINSSESPFIYSKLNQEYNDPIEEQMTTRANTFYHFNLQLKVLSSLQANSYVYQRAKENQAKAKLENRSKLLHKGFLILKNYVQIQKQARQQEERAECHYKSKLQFKIFSILKLVFQLRKAQSLQRITDTTKMNKSTFEFVLSLLFTLHNSKQEDQLKSIDFQSKIVELINSDEASKLYLIVKYFGKHAWITEKNIQNLLTLYRHTICRQIFSILRSQKEKNGKYAEVRGLNLKKQSFYSLKIRWNRFSCYKKKLEAAQAKRNRFLLEKVMKSLLQTVYSTKLYSKRCEYIQRKSLFQLKTKVYKLWAEKAKKEKQRHKELACKGSKVLAKIQSFIKRVVFKKITLEIKEIDDKINSVVNNNIIHRKRNLFCCLRVNHEKISKLKEADSLIQALQCRLAVQKWKQSTKKGKSISKMMLLIKTYYFRLLVLPNLQKSIEIVKEIQQNEHQLMRKIFGGMKQAVIDESHRSQSYQLTLTNKLLFMRKSSAISSIKIFNDSEKKLREAQRLKLMSKKLLEYRHNIKSQLFLTNLFSYYNKSTTQKQTSNHVTKALQTSASKYFYSKIREFHSLRSNCAHLSNLLLKQRAKKTTDKFVVTIHQSKSQKIQRLRRKNSSHELALIMQRSYIKQCHKKEKAIHCYHDSLKKKVLMSLAILVDQYQRVSELAKANNFRNSLETVRCSLAQRRKQHEVAKMHKQYEKKAVLELLTQDRHAKAQSNELISMRFSKLGEYVIDRFCNLKIAKQQTVQMNQKMVYCQQTRGISRLKHFYMSKLIFKKHLYMALKFRALKLCLLAFTALAAKKQPKRSILVTHKGLAERLSTDLVG